MDLVRSARLMRGRPTIDRRRLREAPRPGQDLVEGELLLEQGTTDRLLTEDGKTIRTEQS